MTIVVFALVLEEKNNCDDNCASKTEFLFFKSKRLKVQENIFL